MRKIVQLAAITLAVFAGLTMAANAADTNPTVKIGLYYGSGALFSANLQNYSGSGYQFGYYDSNRSFVPLGQTEQTKISMTADGAIYISGGVYYASAPSGSCTAVGAYHVQLATAFDSFDAAQAAAQALASKGAFPAYGAGRFYVRVGSYATENDAKAAMIPMGVTGAIVTGNSPNAVTVTVTGTSAILFQYDDGGSTDLAVLPKPVSGSAAQTWFKGYRYYGGFEYKRADRGNITVINVLPMQDYIKGVIPYEMSPSWPLEALKAQALCARTYAVKNLSKHSADGFDLCNTTDCQVYRGTSAAGSVTDQAVDETCGMYVRYQGALADTVYFSSDGGATEDVKNIWGTNYPYLKGVLDPYEPVEKISQYNWSVTYTRAQLTALLKEQGYTTGNIVDVCVSEFTGTGNALTVTFTDSSGKKYSFSRARAKSIFTSSSMGKSLRSQRFDIAPQGGGKIYVNGGSSTLTSTEGAYVIGGDGKVSQIGEDQTTVYAMTSDGLSTLGGDADTFVISGTGWGHNVGMSQWGAYGMAQQGFTYDQIIKFYYTGVTIG